jgi:GntR family transcriptional repressor for pyruvate dehydrogenase complex
MRSKEEKFAPVFYTIQKQTKMSEQLFEMLKQEIVCGRLKDGEKLPPHEEFAANLNVSRTVLREALNKLSSLGLVEMQQGRGTYVRHLSPEAVISPMMGAMSLNEKSTRDLIEVRYYVESAVVKLAAWRADTEKISNLRRLIRLMEKEAATGNLIKFAEHDLEFHLYLAQIAGNAVLEMILNTVREMLSKFLETFATTPGVISNALEQHTKILQAISDRDAQRAGRAMEDHLTYVMDLLKKNYGLNFDLPN